jgi:hypothetical protein
MRRSLHALLPLCLVVADGVAQAPELVEGARVRVTNPCAAEASVGSGEPCASLVGTLVARNGDTLLIREQAGSEQTVALRDPVQLWVAQPRRRTVLGLGIGAAVGAVSGFLLAESCRSDPARDDPELCNLAYVLTVPAGAGLGALVGSSMRSHQWIRVPVGDGSVKLGISGRRGISAGLSLDL